MSKSKLVKCAIPACTTMLRRPGLCAACSSWWHRMKIRTGAQLATYLYRHTRTHSRITSRNPHSSE